MPFITNECSKENRHGTACSKSKECECACHQDPILLPNDQGIRG